MLSRTISKITQNPWHQGFLGRGHSASAVLDGIPFEESDPFILFMDDKLDLPGGEPVGGAHPHAGFETLTLVLQGNEKEWKTGSFELMTAGKGIVHTEEITSEQKIHILQVWLVLPPEKRWTTPFWQKIMLEEVPTIQTDNYQILVYSGSSNGLVSLLKNHTPLTLVDFKMKANQSVSQELPTCYGGLVYVLKGSVQVGNKTIESGQAGWIDKPKGVLKSEIVFTSKSDVTHFILYAAQAHKAPVVSHGPFIGDTKEDIARLYKEYRNGEMPHLDDLPNTQKIEYHQSNVNE
jgi:quercetin 2,3-dioxygenase